MTDFVAFQLQVDVANPKDVREKLPRAERALADMEREIAEMRARADRWKALVEGLRSVAGLSGDAPSAPAPVGTSDAPPAAAAKSAGTGGRAQMQALILEAMAEIGRPIKSSGLAVYLASRGHAFSLDSVSNALWYAADRRTIRKVARGIYAPLDHDAEESAPKGADSEVPADAEALMVQVAPPGPSTVQAHPLHNGTVPAPAPAMIRT